jgi:hypothetical protein
LAFFARLAVFRPAARFAAVFLVLEREAAARAALFRRAVPEGVALAGRAVFLAGRFAALFLTAFRGALVAILILQFIRTGPTPARLARRRRLQGTICNGPAKH